ncbi:vacuolar protein sorting/targeting protein PEP1, partial [Ceratobasidium sp. 392]
MWFTRLAALTSLVGIAHDVSSALGPTLALSATTWTDNALGFGVSAQNPGVKVTKFENLPKNLFYFDDTSTILYHDSVEGNVWMSEDEGRSWAKVEGVPSGDAMILVEHPFENRMAFILGEGKKHWRTNNRGKTWQSFEMPHPVALTSSPLSFHSDKKNAEWILMQVWDCKKTNWGFSQSCHSTTYYTEDAFSSPAKILMEGSQKCIFAHSSSVKTVSGGKKKATFAPKRPPSQ